MERFFSKFDFAILKKPSFKEDAVREELLVPLLHALGYAASGENTIERSSPLLHPFVNIGSKRHKIHLFPDYILRVNGQRKWVLDAKAPTEDVHGGKNAEQAYSYAIHKDVRVELYALCNGADFVLFHISREEPLVDVKLHTICVDLGDIWRHLSPKAILLPHAVDYWPDLGLQLFKLGCRAGFKFELNSASCQFIVRLDDGHYSLNAGADVDGIDMLGSFDFDEKLYRKLLKIGPPGLSSRIIVALQHQPYRIQLGPLDFLFNIRAQLGDRILWNKEENYIPFVLKDVGPATPPVEGKGISFRLDLKKDDDMPGSTI